MTRANAGYDCGRRICASECAAVRQLETALRLYSEGDDYFSVVTLAGAADELFGKQIREPAVKSLAKDAAKVHEMLHQEQIDEKVYVDRANETRNALKHLSEIPDDNPIDMCEEARDMLWRAIENYELLTGCRQDRYWRYITTAN